MVQSSAKQRRSTFKGTLSSFLGETLLLPTGLVTTVFLTRRLGPDEYGLFTLAATIVAWIEWSATSMFSRSTVKFISEAEDWRPVGTTLLQQYLIVGISAALLLCLLAHLIAETMSEPGFAGYLILFALEIPLFAASRAHRSILTGLGHFSKQAFAASCRWIARLVLIVLLVQLGFSITGAILGSVGAVLVELSISRLHIRPPLFHLSTFPARQVWDYAVPLTLYALSMRLYSSLDILMLKVLGGTAEQAGFYGAAQNLTLVLGLFSMSFAPVLLSNLNRILRDDNLNAAKRMAEQAMRMVLLILPFAALTAGAAPEIVHLIFGPKYSPTAPLVALLIFAAIAQTMISVTTVILIAASKPNWTFALTGPLIPLVAIGHWLLIPNLGAVGASLSTTLFATVGAIAAVLAVYYIWKILPPHQTLWRSILVCGLACALAAYWPVPGFWLLLKLLVITLVITLAFLLLGEFSANDIALVRSITRCQTVPQEKPQNPRKF